MHFPKYFKAFDKIILIRSLALLAILIIFPVILSSSTKQHNTNSLVFAAPPQQNNPGVGASPTAQTVFWVYGGPLVGDQIAAGWGNSTTYGGGNTVNLLDTTHVYNGIHSISYQVTAQYTDKCALVINAGSPPLDLTPYVYLSFYALGTQQGQNYGVQLLDTNGTPIGAPVSMINYGGPIPINPPWFVYNIPLTALGSPSSTRGILISDITGSAQPNVYLDDITFSNVRGEVIQAPPQIGPPNTPMPTPTTTPDYYPNISPWVYIIPTLIVFIAVLFQ